MFKENVPYKREDLISGRVKGQPLKSGAKEIKTGMTLYPGLVVLGFKGASTSSSALDAELVKVPDDDANLEVDLAHRDGGESVVVGDGYSVKLVVGSLFLGRFFESSKVIRELRCEFESHKE